MNQISDPPLNYDAGTEFDYAVWEPGTEVILCNVPWDAQYRNVWMPGDDSHTPVQRRALLNAYIESLPNPFTKIPGGSPVRVDVPVRVGLSHNNAQRYNYLRARQPLLPPGANPTGDIQKDYYYFILNARYINPGTTELTLQLDVFQTYIYDAEFGNSYIERGHVGIANSRQMDNNGRDFLTVPEGIDTGAEYQIVTTRREKIKHNNVDRYNILVCSAVDLRANPGSVDDPDNPPRIVTATGGMFSGIASGAKYYVIETAQSLAAFMDYWKDKPWITQSILSLTLIPPIKRYIPDFKFPSGVDQGIAEAPANFQVSIYHDLWKDWRVKLKDAFPDRYKALNKLLTYPYTAIELTTFTGTPLILRPEAWNNPNASIIERGAYIPPNQRLIFFPRFYNVLGNPVNSIDDDDPGEYYDLMTQIAGFPSVALVNNAHVGYLASNMNVNQQAYAQADWSQQRAMRGAQVGYDNQQSAFAAARQQVDAQQQYQGASLQTTQQLERDNLLVNTFLGGLLGGAQSLAAGPRAAAMTMGGSAGNGLVGGLTMGNTQSSALEQLRHQTNQAYRSNDIATAQGQMVADANFGLAQFAAKGDYEQAIAGIDARIQDSRLLQPSVSGQTGGEFLHLIHDTMQVAARWKLIDNAALATIGEYWLQFGYSVHRRYTPPKSLHVMSKFTYWKMTEAVILTAPMPEGFKNALRGMFEKGLTLWKNPADIGKVDYAENQPLPGISLVKTETSLPIYPPSDPNLGRDMRLRNNEMIHACWIDQNGTIAVQYRPRGRITLMTDLAYWNGVVAATGASPNRVSNAELQSIRDLYGDMTYPNADVANTDITLITQTGTNNRFLLSGGVIAPVTDQTTIDFLTGRAQEINLTLAQIQAIQAA